jgi:GntR family transcriptional regulator
MPKSPVARATTLKPPPAAAQPLYAALRERLKAEILGGRRKPGAKLPSEAELTAQLGVSRITVRQALSDLQKEGLVLKVHGKGSFVAAPPVTHELSRLAGLAEALSGAGRTIHTRVLSLKSVKAPAAAASALGLTAGTAVTQLRTLRYLDRAPLVLCDSWIPLDIGTRLKRADLAGGDVLSLCEQSLGIAIGDAEVSIGAISADRRHGRLLGVPEGAALVAVRRLVRGADGRPIHVESGAYRADRFQYHLTLSRGGR